MAAETSRDISDAARRLFLECGYAQVTAVVGIARQAGRRGNRAIDTEFRGWTFRNRPAGTPHASRQ
ncbi:hypothetical protein ACFV0C_23240 [Streptomyces sp. NPDC059568]|uniref:hypothetical protein n=1 Tax=Streptomyces sp. NPDC059568 TaxID=3346868 RepID=UPI0036BF28CC